MYIAAYDIMDDRRRRKVAGHFQSLALGGQQSVIEFRVSQPAAIRFAQTAEELIDIEEDRIHLFHVGNKPVLLGTAKAVEYDEGMVVI